MNRQTQRPYEKKTASRLGGLVFGIGVGALLATLALAIGLMLPGISNRLEYLPYYARTYYRKVFPPPQYLPTPAPTVAVNAAVAGENPAPIEPKVLPPTSTATPPAPAIPAAVNLEEVTPTADNPEATEETLFPTPTPPLTPTATATPATPVATLALAGEGVQLANFKHQWQTWNNCGPATITMNTGYFGRPETQVEAAQFLKPNRDDKNVSPQELAAYAQSLGLETMVRQGGSLEQLKAFLSQGLPVLAETWLVHEGDGLGHYRLVTGYDDPSRKLYTFDSLNGPAYTVSYDQFDADWRVFNRLYLVVYPKEQAETVAAILGSEMDEAVLRERLAAEARAEIEANPNDAIAYFNLGDVLTQQGQYEAASSAFDEARRLGLHWRRLWYQFTPFEAYYKAGRYQDVLDLAQATLSSSGGLEEVYYYQGLALHATNQAGATEAFQAALDYNPNFAAAQEALDQLVEAN